MQLTVRGIDPELAKAIRRMAEEEGLSLNQAALKLLAKAANLPGRGDTKRVIGHDLDHLFGTWKPAEADAFLHSIRSCEQIDEAASRRR